MSEENKNGTETVTENEAETKAAEETSGSESTAKKKKPFLSQNKVEILVAIFLGITALLTAWASWIGSLHGGNQATNYTKSNNLASEGNSEYNSGLQNYLSDLMAWNTITEYEFEEAIAEANGETAAAELINAKIQTFWEQNGSQILADAYEVFDKNRETMESPFEVEGMMDKYFENANELLSESQELLEQGMEDNKHGDAYNLVSVIYSVVLFMLGIVGIFKGIPNRAAVLCIAVAALIVATIYMITIPMPTGFDLGSFFTAK